MSKSIADVKKTKMCTFCKHWSDLSNSNIKPKSADGRIWEYEPSTFCICSQGKGKRRATSTCKNFENKISK
jgi:hypothetical protein